MKLLISDGYEKHPFSFEPIVDNFYCDKVKTYQSKRQVLFQGVNWVCQMMAESFKLYDLTAFGLVKFKAKNKLFFHYLYEKILNTHKEFADKQSDEFHKTRFISFENLKFIDHTESDLKGTELIFLTHCLKSLFSEVDIETLNFPKEDYKEPNIFQKYSNLHYAIPPIPYLRAVIFSYASLFVDSDKHQLRLRHGDIFSIENKIYNIKTSKGGVYISFSTDENPFELCGIASFGYKTPIDFFKQLK